MVEGWENWKKYECSKRKQAAFYPVLYMPQIEVVHKYI